LGVGGKIWQPAADMCVLLDAQVAQPKCSVGSQNVSQMGHALLRTDGFVLDFQDLAIFRGRCDFLTLMALVRSHAPCPFGGQIVETSQAYDFSNLGELPVDLFGCLCHQL
jgi:hypothetical protein